jgi:transposase
VDLVFFDTTSLYFEGFGGQTIGKRRDHNKDHRPDLKQMVVGMAGLKQELESRMKRAICNGHGRR